MQKNFVLEFFFLTLYHKSQEEIMKTKTFGKKLTLNKETIADLNSSELMNALGGVPGPAHAITDACPTSSACTADPTGIPECPGCIGC
jgi:hypothetical protein